MKNWKAYVEKKNAKTYVIPAGWDSRDTIAEQLECSPDKVDDHLRPALKSGEVIKQSFKVWDDLQKRLLFVVCYREADKRNSQPAPIGAPAQPFDDPLPVMKRLKAEGKTYAEIAAVVGKTRDAVRNILRRAA